MGSEGWQVENHLQDTLNGRSNDDTYPGPTHKRFRITAEWILKQVCELSMNPIS